MFCRNTEKWLYRVTGDYTWRSGVSIPKDMEFVDQKGKVRLRISEDGAITVTKRYTWDGCTPKFCLLDVLLGIPDGAVYSGPGEHTGKPKTYHASLIHDALYQFLNKDLPYNRKDADLFFLRLMQETGFKLSGVYYIAVRIFGGLANRLSVTYGKKRVMKAT